MRLWEGRPSEDERPPVDAMSRVRERTLFRKQVTAAGFQLKGSGWYSDRLPDGGNSGAPREGRRQRQRQNGAANGASGRERRGCQQPLAPRQIRHSRSQQFSRGAGSTGCNAGGQHARKRLQQRLVAHCRPRGRRTAAHCFGGAAFWRYYDDEKNDAQIGVSDWPPGAGAFGHHAGCSV